MLLNVRQPTEIKIAFLHVLLQKNKIERDATKQKATVDMIEPEPELGWIASSSK
jgi:hypothetical protein